MIVAPGYIYSEDSPIAICNSGLHGSRKVIDALFYSPGSYLCLVDMWGGVQDQNDKLVARHRHVIAAADVSSELRLWACWCVRRVWNLLTDERSRRAVEVAEAYACGEASSEDLIAAWDAAGAAVGAAARDASMEATTAAMAAAAVVARPPNVAARTAADRAAAAVARDAKDAKWNVAWNVRAARAYDAVWNAASEAQSNELERRMLVKLGVDNG
jgi:hypothetical protein